MKTINTHVFLYYSQIVIIILLCVVFINQHTCLLCWLFHRSHTIKKLQSHENKQCEAHKCGAIDDVNNPAYNMQNVVKQSILLEEHLAEKNKYCISCIVKHFQHIIGLVEEAQWMAGVSISKYPHIEESAQFYQVLFKKWLNGQNNDKVKLDVLNQLRERRRTLIDIYFLSN